MPNERQVPVPIEEEMRKSYLDYAMSVIVGPRAAGHPRRPEAGPPPRPVRDAGARAHWNRAYKKSARVVGDCMGKYHPHGDAPIYDALVRMVQEFSLRYPLVDGQGNFGSVDGDPAGGDALHRSAAGEDRPRDAGRHRQGHRRLRPELRRVRAGAGRPARRGSRISSSTARPGIAVGMATNIPPHNLSEVVDGLVALIDRPETTIEQLHEDRQGSRLSDARLHLRRRRHPRGVHDGPRHHHAAREGARREDAGRARGDHRHRAAVPGEQGDPDREDLRAVDARRRSTASPRSATSRTARASAS